LLFELPYFSVLHLYSYVGHENPQYFPPWVIAELETAARVAILWHRSKNSLIAIPDFMELQVEQHGTTLFIAYPLALSIRSRPIVGIGPPQYRQGFCQKVMNCPRVSS